MAERGGVLSPDLARVQGISDRSLSRAERSLGTMLGHSVRFAVRGVHAVSSSALPSLAEDAERDRLAVLRFRILGQGGGWILLLFSRPTIYRLLQLLMGTPATPRDLTEMERSAVREVGNLLASSFLSELGDLVGRRLMLSPPEIHFEQIPRVVRELLGSLPALGREVLVIQARLEDPGGSIHGRYFVVPEVGTLEPIAPVAAGERGVVP
jgi:chemotaxis protein CheC